MAYVVLLSLTQTINQILSHDEHYPISVTGKQQIKSLHEQEIIFQQEFLEKLPKEDNSLETRIIDAANEAEDVLENFMYEHTRLHHKSIRSTDFPYDFHELKTVMNEFKSISEVVVGLIETERVLEIGGRPAMQSAPSSPPTPAPAIDDVTIGLEERVKEIRGLLCGGPLERQIIPITGMGGIGKTTLAKTVYHDEEVKEKFPVRAWITVTPEYKIDTIFADLLCFLENIEGGFAESNGLTVQKLNKILTAKKYLIVVDDIWSGKAWDDMKIAFGDPKKLNGSRILITTRNENVASHAYSSSHVHLQKMKLMDSGQSWKLLKHKVFGDKECPPQLEKIGRDIATRCRGHPLAIVVVAGNLSTRSEKRSSWEEVAENVRSIIQKDEEFQKRMALSYIDLPLYLRPCFLYMGGFPENSEIRLSKLLKLWIVEGFVANEMEGEGYVIDLVKRNLAMVLTTKSNGTVKSCNIHEFICDMGKIVALDENYERRMSIAHPDIRCVAKGYASTLRSAICFRPTKSSLGALRKLKLLRVLDVVDTNAYSLPASVFELFHLRYLAFGCPMEIPAAISKLQNLRTLVIRPSKRLRRYSTDEVYLPLEIWMMPLLTHLVSFFDLLPNPEGATSAIKELLTLSVVKKLICTQEMMKLICKVKKLAITYFGDKYQEDYQLENLSLLHQLEKLTLVVKKGSLLQLKANPVFPKTLRKLTLSGWGFPWEDMKIVASLPNLQVLKLRDHAFEGNTWHTVEESDEEAYVEQFPKLELLLIEESDLENWVTEKDHFPVLKRLVLSGCGKLSEIPDDIGDIVTLELIEIDRANTSLMECVQRIHKEQIEEYDNKLLQVRAL